MNFKKLRNQRLPDILYKYYDSSRSRFFSDYRVRFSQLGALNDPFEFLINIKPGELRKAAIAIALQQTSTISLIKMGIEASIRSIRSHEHLNNSPNIFRIVFISIFIPAAVLLMVISGPFLRRHFQSLMGAMADDFEQALERARSDMFVVFSSSETWNSVPMWAHYAGNHSGFCVGFDPNTAFKNHSRKSKHPYLLPRKCKYLKAAPSLNRRTINLVDFAASKMDHWSYEREWRFVGFPEDAALRGNMVSGHELLLFQMQPEAIKEVVFGANCPPSLVSEVIERLNASNITPTLYQVQNSAGYGFERRKILTAQDVFVLPSNGAPIRGITPEMFKGAEDAYVEMMLDADNHRILRNLLNRD